tara:strand:+ start:797 stop:1108 length:312 start_codon:yes stop_codon:yes gene_type:complete
MKTNFEKASDGMDYFNEGFLDELTTDKKFYVQAFMDYIVELETHKVKTISRIKKMQEIMRVDIEVFEEGTFSAYELVERINSQLSKEFTYSIYDEKIYDNSIN